jgi:leader peptidase (prepilin peptidase) / N-methyltransferase
MGLAFFLFAGFLVGSVICACGHPKEPDKPVLKWYAGVFYKDCRYLFVQTSLAVGFAVLYGKFGVGMQFAVYCALACLLAAAARVDLQERIIPDKLVAAGALAGVVTLFVNRNTSMLSAFLGMAAAGGLLWILSYVTKGGIGLGDAKLFACVGLYLGLERVLTAMLFSTLLSGLTGLILIVANFKNRKKTIPFAPYILVGTMVTVAVTL